MGPKTGLTDDVKRVLRAANKPMSRAEISAAITVNASPSSVSATLAGLVNQGLALRHGSGAATRYGPPDPTGTGTGSGTSDDNAAHPEARIDRGQKPAPAYVLYTDGSLAIHQRNGEIVHQTPQEARDLARFLRLVD